MNIQTLIENLKNTIAGKEALLEAWKDRPAKDWDGTGVTHDAMSKMVRINIDELHRIMLDAMECREDEVARNIELAKLQKAQALRNWIESPDRMGGQFTQDEINDSKGYN